MNVKIKVITLLLIDIYNDVLPFPCLKSVWQSDGFYNQIYFFDVLKKNTFLRRICKSVIFMNLLKVE